MKASDFLLNLKKHQNKNTLSGMFSKKEIKKECLIIKKSQNKN